MGKLIISTKLTACKGLFVLFSPAQMREFSGLTENTISNWRNAGIACLKNKKGRKPQYTIAEIATLIVLDKLKHGHGGRVELIVPMASEVETICSSIISRFFKDEKAIGFLRCADGQISYHTDRNELLNTNCPNIIIIQFAPLIKGLRDFISLNPVTQLTLQLR